MRMRKCELAALRSKALSRERFEELTPPTLEGLGLAVDSKGRGGQLVVRDHAELGCVVWFSSSSLAQRAALVLARLLSQPVEVYEVIGTSIEGGFKFRTAAYQATPDGALSPSEGVELDLEDPEEDWGGGTLEARTQRVLLDFGDLPGIVAQESVVGFKRLAGGKPSSPRVASLVALLKKAKNYESSQLDDGRVELRVELAKGGRQTSYCTMTEFEELESLAKGRKR